MADKKTAMSWTVSETKALLEVTLDYKREKAKQNLDWKSYPSTYEDIWKAFRKVYPVKKAKERDLAFQHDEELITKARVIFKLKDMQRRYNKAKESYGVGRYMEDLYGLCQMIWEENSLLCLESKDLLEDSVDSFTDWASEGSSWRSSETETGDDLEDSAPPSKIRRRLEEDFNEVQCTDRERKEENFREVLRKDRERWDEIRRKDRQRWDEMRRKDRERWEESSRESARLHKLKLEEIRQSHEANMEKLEDILNRICPALSGLGSTNASQSQLKENATSEDKPLLEDGPL